MSVKAILDCNREGLATCRPEDLLVHAVKLMDQLSANALAVMDDTGHLAGIITDHDIIRALADCSGCLSDESVSLQMSSKVVTCTPDTKLMEALALMGKHSIRHLIVLDGKNPVGILSIRDVLKRMHENEALEIDTLRDIAIASRAAVVRG